MSDAFWASLFASLLAFSTLVKQWFSDRRAEARAIEAAKMADAQAKASIATDKKLDANTATTNDIKKQTDGLTDVLVKTEARASAAEGEIKGAKDEHAKQSNRAPTMRTRKSDKARKRKATT